MPKISVLTPSVRPEGLALVEKALRRQTFREFEHIVQGREKDLTEGLLWSLNRDYNTAIKKSTAPLIVSWQDWTYANPDCLERFWQHYLDTPRTIVSAVGNKYADEGWLVMTWKDPRERSDQGTYYPCYFNDIEWNLCSVPREALYAAGGFDEAMDQRYGYDGLSVNDRLNILGGWEFMIDQHIKSYSLEHGRPPDWDTRNWFGDPYNEYRKKYIENPHLPYLR